MGTVAFLTDPTLWFCIFCYLVAPFKPNENITNEQRIGYFTDPFVLGPWGIVFLTIATTGKKKELSRAEQMKANWYLFNGPTINMGLDAFVGLLDKIPLFRAQYVKLDARYRDHEAVVSTIAGLELTLYPVLCIALYRAYWQDANYRIPLEIATTAIQFYGTIMFVFCEMWDGNPNIKTDRNFEFSVDHIVYFWFGYLANYIWFIVPGLLGWNAFKEASALIEKATKGKKNK